MMSGPTNPIPSTSSSTQLPALGGGPQATPTQQPYHYATQTPQFSYMPQMNERHLLVPPTDDDYDDGLEGSAVLREQDRLLPIANVARIMKMAVPPNAKIAKDAKETVQECVSEFIAFVTSEASDRCQQEKRKTINGDDVLWAMESLGFDHYVQLLKIYLQKYKESLKLDKDSPPTLSQLLPGHQMHRSALSMDDGSARMQPSMSLFHPRDTPHA